MLPQCGSVNMQIFDQLIILRLSFDLPVCLYLEEGPSESEWGLNVLSPKAAPLELFALKTQK